MLGIFTVEKWKVVRAMRTRNSGGKEQFYSLHVPISGGAGIRYIPGEIVEPVSPYGVFVYKTKEIAEKFLKEKEKTLPRVKMKLLSVYVNPLEKFERETVLRGSFSITKRDLFSFSKKEMPLPDDTEIYHRVYVSSLIEEVKTDLSQVNNFKPVSDTEVLETLNGFSNTIKNTVENPFSISVIESDFGKITKLHLSGLKYVIHTHPHQDYFQDGENVYFFDKPELVVCENGKTCVLRKQNEEWELV